MILNYGLLKFNVLILICLFLLFPYTFPQAESQQQDDPDGTQLILDPPASSVLGGNQITFTGRYIYANGVGISGLEIKIRDWDGNCFLCTSDTLATGYTDTSGYFSITWTAYCEDNEDPCTMEIFAERVQGDGDIVRTSYYSVAIIQISTSLILDQPASTVTEGDIVTFTGRLTRNDNGEGIAGQIIYIYDDDGEVDDLIGTGITDSNGYYSIDWIAADIDVQDDVMDTYAYYYGTDEFEASGSYLYYVEVTKSSTSTILQLDEPPSQVNEGDTVTFTGRLTRTDTGEGLSGQRIYI